MIEKTRKDIFDHILRLCSLYILIWTISPPLQHPIIYRGLGLIAGVLWVLISWMKIGKLKTDVHGVYISICLFCVFTIMIVWASGGGLVDATVTQLQLIILLLFVLQYAYYSQQDKDFIKVLTIVTFFCLSIWQIRTLIEYEINPGVSRLLVRSSDQAQYYAAQGVGGYGLIYPSIFTNAALMYLFSKWKGLKKILLLIPLTIGILLVLSSGFLIAVVMTLVSLGGWLIGLFSRKNITAILLSLIGLVAIAFLVINVLLKYSNEILQALDGTFYQRKVEEIITALQTSEVTGKLEGRTSRYLESIIGMFKYPIIGAKILGLESELGGHSTLLDLLGLFGVFSIGFYFAIGHVLKSIYQKAVHKGYVAAIIVLFLLNGILNTLVGSHGIIFIVVPGVILLAKTEN